MLSSNDDSKPDGQGGVCIMRKPKYRKCRVVITKGWAKNNCAWAIYDPEYSEYHILSGIAAHMIYSPEYIKEYTV